MDQLSQCHDDEIDLREIILTLARGWKVILLFIAMGGVSMLGYSTMQMPVYEASAQVLVDPSIYSTTTTTTTTTVPTLLLSGSVRQRTADILGVDVNLLNIEDNQVLPIVAIESDTQDKTLYTIVVQGLNAQETMDIANVWAESSVEYTAEVARLLLVMEEPVRSEQNEARRALVEYLKKNDLNQLTWVDLQILTGVGVNELNGNILIPTMSNWPKISPAQRLEIAIMMQAQLDADKAYAKVSDLANQIRLMLVTKHPQVFRLAMLPEKPVRPKTFANVMLGVVFGVMLGVFWLFFAAWWNGGKNK